MAIVADRGYALRMIWITAPKVIALVADMDPQIVSKENRANLENRYSHHAVDFADNGDVIWNIPRGIGAESIVAVARVSERRLPQQAILSMAEGDLQGRLSLAHGKPALHTMDGEVYDLRTGRRV